jgi:1,2-diacylglycerol 3-alpha-glucosyltransferase
VRIGFFTDSFRPYTSGVVRSIELFAREFTNRGHEVYIFGPDYPLIHCPREEKVFRFLSIPAPMMPEFSIPIPFSAQIGNTIRRISLDLIHVHSPFLLGRLGAFAARQHGLPLIFTFHTLYEQYVHYLPIARQTSRLVVQNIGRDFCNRCSMVIAPSHLVENYLRDTGVTVKIAVIPTGIDVEEFREADPFWLQKRYRIAGGDRILLFAGRLGREKNIIFLLRSFHRLLQIIPGLRLVIAGGGPQEGELRNTCLELGISGRVIFTGLLSREEIAHCYAAADLFVFPSVTETQGLVIAEAKAAGLPVVAINAFGAAETVRHGEDGLLAENSLDSFTMSMAGLLQDRSLYEQMKRNALANAASLSSSHSAERMLYHYEELLRSSSPTSPPSPPRLLPV